MSVVRGRRSQTRRHISQAETGPSLDLAPLMETISDLKEEITILKKQVEEVKGKKGPKGEQGERGPAGKQGEKGPKGAKGESLLPTKFELDKLEDGMGLVWSTKKKAFVAQKIFEED